MAEIHRGAGLTPSKLELLAAWMPAQRWYTGKTTGVAPALERVGGYRLDDPAGEVGIEVVVVLDTSGPSPVTYQVPLTYRGREAPELAHALVGTAQHGVLGQRWVYDGCHDPVFAAAFLDLLTGRARAQHATRSATPEPDVAGTTRGDATHVRLGSHTVLTGEQSNTSLLCELVTSSGAPLAPVMVKVFRVLAPGENPDVVLSSALSDAGSPYVPLVFGYVSASWDLSRGRAGARGDGAGRQPYHLAFAQELLVGAEDAWRIAVRDAAAGTSLARPAYALGAMTAHVHRTLASALGSRVVTETERQRFVGALRARAAAAVAEVPELSHASDAVGKRLDALDAVPLEQWPPLQRVHGDYHLGQVLRAGSRWAVIDFEGEPLRPLAERSLPDLALRDVAGMLRSFDYAGGAATLSGTPAPRGWVSEAQEAFEAGYLDVAPQARAELRGPILAALQLDKALYEAVYEARQRPTWLPIPLAALDRLLGWTPAPAPSGTVENVTKHTEQRTHTDGAAMTAPAPIDHSILGPVARGEYPLPHDVLGAHLADGVLTLRGRHPLADGVTFLLSDGAGGVTRLPARHEIDGIWTAATEATEVPDYRVEVVYDGYGSVIDDPYRFLPTLGELDIYLIGEGRHERLWEALGAHLRTFPSEMGEVHGASFSVWAPNAQAVRVVGDFNGWDGREHAMRSLGSAGIWEIFVPGVEIGARYKFEIRFGDGSWHQKADPMARASEVPPATASVVTSSSYEWKDEDWLARRAASDPHQGPMSVYELHFGSWKKGLSYRQAAEDLVEYLTWTGFTHVELMPLAEHPFGGSWGYQVTSYYAPTARFGVPDDLRYLIDCLHQAGIGVLLDWVPAHFPKDDFALGRFDGTALYEHPDPRRGEHKDWGTYIFNFGRTEVRNFLVANAAYWLEEFHIDGLRVDAVASMLYLDYSREPGEWEPNIYGGRENLEAISFIQEANAVAYRVAPGAVMIAEESTAYGGVTAPTEVGGLGFGLKWNMGWMNDTLRYLAEDPINRRYHHGELTFSLIYAYTEQFLLPLSHDEVVHGKGSLLAKMPGDYHQKLAGLRGLLAYLWSHPGKQLLFMGGEFGQGPEWNDEAGLEWWHLDVPEHRGVVELTRRLNAIYRETPALWSQDFSPEGFQWLDANDGDHNALVYLRADRHGNVVVCVQSFAGMTHENYRIPLPFGGTWNEILNTDAVEYGGYGVGNLGRIRAEQEAYHGRSHSATIRLPAFGAVWFAPAAPQAANARTDAEEAAARAVEHAKIIPSATVGE